MEKFKQINYSNIIDDDFMIKSKELLGIANPKASGSYLRYGKEKACDLDLSEQIEYSNQTLKEYFEKLKKRSNEFILVRLYCDVIDESIDYLIKKLGNLNGLLEIENSVLNKNDVIDLELPDKMKQKITKLIEAYVENKNILTYVNLYMYLKKHLHLPMTIEEALNGEKKYNGKYVKMDNNFTHIYIEIILDNFRVSNYIYFNKQTHQESTTMKIELNDVLIKSLTKHSINKYQMSYHNLLKFFFHFLKKGYFNKIFEERPLINNAIRIYNEIYDFREKIGDMNNNLCKIENMIIMDKQNKKLKKEYKKVKLEFELKCKNYFLQVSKPYSKYLRLYIKLI